MSAINECASDPPVFHRYYLGCLSHASYLIGDKRTGRAAVIDPRRDVDEYITDAESDSLEIVAVVETHLHADFVSGHQELARRTGATIYLGRAAPADFPRHAVQEGDEILLGPSVRLRFLETPGHTLESATVLAYTPADSETPSMAFTGDTLFIGDVGRPDLAGAVISAEDLALHLHRSLSEKVLALPDSVKVYPAHGAGSSCGKALRDADVSTIGTEKATNPALLHISDPERFVADLLADLPPAPGYFSMAALKNRSVVGDVGDLLISVPELTPHELEEAMEDGAVVLDTRAPEAFGAGHIAGALHIDLEGRFAPWVGVVVPVDAPVVVMADPEHRDEALVRLARIGYEVAVGTYTRPIGDWEAAGGAVATTPAVSAEALKRKIASGAPMYVLDVRTQAEWEAGHIAGARHIPLPRLPEALPSLDKDTPITVICGSGYRSSIACSLLQRSGFRDVQNVSGGWAAWQAHSVSGNELPAPEALPTSPHPAIVSAPPTSGPARR